MIEDDMVEIEQLMLVVVLQLMVRVLSLVVEVLPLDKVIVSTEIYSVLGILLVVSMVVHA